MQIAIQTEYIHLTQLLKVAGICTTGGQAKLLIEQGLVKLNGITETRKRAKVKSGDRVEYADKTYTID